MVAGFLVIVFLCAVELGLALLVVQDKSYPGDENNTSLDDPINTISRQ
ncbi:hypothetical protein [Alkalihalobacillus sp. AL-G]|nr:hypothetical protein [Alkalihalobacillus sp. AL-G]WLD91579.1 hypothetical protein MOJ78_11025 [Alkalihalobacillus sp. AL-G]